MVHFNNLTHAGTNALFRLLVYNVILHTHRHTHTQILDRAVGPSAISYNLFDVVEIIGFSGFTFRISCLRKRSMKARSEMISFWDGRGPSAHRTQTKESFPVKSPFFDPRYRSAK